MVYLEINGLRLEQRTLLAIAETVVATNCLSLFVILSTFPCFRPKKSRIPWAGMWRVSTVLYVLATMVTEVVWVQVSLLTESKHSAVPCQWSQSRLAAWTGLQLMCLLCLLGALTYMRRQSVALMVNGTLGIHAMGIMSFAMLSMYEAGPCFNMIFPMFSGSMGMSFVCCCGPWYMGAWSTKAYHLPTTTTVNTPRTSSSPPLETADGGNQNPLVSNGLLFDLTNPTDPFEEIDLTVEQTFLTSNNDDDDDGGDDEESRGNPSHTPLKLDLTSLGLFCAKRRQKKRAREQRKRRLQPYPKGPQPILATHDDDDDDEEDSSALTTSDDENTSEEEGQEIELLRNPNKSIEIPMRPISPSPSASVSPREEGPMKKNKEKDHEGGVMMMM